MALDFQLRVFLVASALNLFLSASSLVEWCIRCAVSQLAKEARTKKAIKRIDISDLWREASKPPFGKIIGFLERELYLYALVAGITDLLVGVLAFKGFTSWLLAKPDETNSGKSHSMLGRFYSYALGNFISLAFALAIFEILRQAIARDPHIRALLWVAV